MRRRARVGPAFLAAVIERLGAGRLDRAQAARYVAQVFDLGFGEMLVIALVLLVVVGPRELPRLLRTAGQGISKLRNMSRDLRAQSGIDDLIRDEGLDKDLRALRSLSKGKVVDAIVNDAAPPPRPASVPTAAKVEGTAVGHDPAPGAASADGLPTTAAAHAGESTDAGSSARDEPRDSPPRTVERERLGMPDAPAAKTADGDESTRGGATT